MKVVSLIIVILSPAHIVCANYLVRLFDPQNHNVTQKHSNILTSNNQNVSDAFP